MPSFLWSLINAAQAAFLVLWTAFWILAALLVRAVTRDTQAPLAMARRLWAPALLAIGGMRLTAEGTERVDFSKPHFFAVNHQSIVDILAMFYAVPAPLLFILKEELRKVPFLGWYVSAMGMIFIPRGERRRSLENLKQCRKRLRQGHSILMFPEGTRSRNGEVGAFKTSTFVPAIDTETPVVPVALDGPGRILPPGGFRARPGRIRVAFGRPIATAGLDRAARRELADAVRGEIVELHRALRVGARELAEERSQG